MNESKNMTPKHQVSRSVSGGDDDWVMHTDPQGKKYFYSASRKKSIWADERPDITPLDDLQVHTTSDGRSCVALLHSLLFGFEFGKRVSVGGERKCWVLRQRASFGRECVAALLVLAGRLCTVLIPSRPPLITKTLTGTRTANACGNHFG